MKKYEKCYIEGEESVKVQKVRQVQKVNIGREESIESVEMQITRQIASEEIIESADRKCRK